MLRHFLWGVAHSARTCHSGEHSSQGAGMEKRQSKHRWGRKENKRREDAIVKTVMNQQASKPPKQSWPKSQWLHVKNLTPSHQPDQCRGKSTSVTHNHGLETEEVDGDRYVWGIFRGYSSKTVLTVLQKLSTVAEKVEVQSRVGGTSNTNILETGALLQTWPEQQWAKLQLAEALFLPKK